MLECSFGPDPGREITYFPPGALDDDGLPGTLVLPDYILDVLREEPLHTDAETRPPTYRLICFRPNRCAAVIRVSRGDDGWQVSATVLAGLVDPVWNCTGTLHTHASARIEQLIDRLHFSTLPAVVAKRTGEERDLWLLEGVEDHEYHLIERTSPKEPELVEFGRFLVEVSGVDRCRRPPTARELRSKASARAKVERARKQKTVRSHQAARLLLRQLEAEGLTCPHCRARRRDMRFIDRSPSTDWMSAFICKSCGRSFAPDEIA